MKNNIRNLFLLSALIVQSLAHAGSISNVSMPTINENRYVTPFEVDFNPPLEKGESFYLVTGSDTYAMKVEVDGNEKNI
jgi:hypothetical protein